MSQPKPNIKQAVPFFAVSDMSRSLRFYVDGLGFEMTNQWMPAGKIEWCWLRRDNAALMLQEFSKQEGHQKNIEAKKGGGISIYFQCEDAIALYQEFSEKGLNPSEPFVGNNMWDVSLEDPDGYHLHFESMTDTPEETKYSEWKKMNNI